MLPAVFGCEIVFKDALPWAMPLNLSEDEVMKLEVPDLLQASPMTAMMRQIDYLQEKYGRVVGDINTTGVQNLALKLRGDQLYIDYFENPEPLPAPARHLRRMHDSAFPIHLQDHRHRGRGCHPHVRPEALSSCPTARSSRSL